MNSKIKMIGAAALMATAVSCTQMSPSGTETLPDARVVLGQNNYRVLATQVSGEDTGFSLFPVVKAVTGTIGSLVPYVDSSKIPSGLVLKSPSEMKALHDLYEKSGAITPGRATQLINVRKEVGGFNAIIFGRPRVRITGDLIEFTH